MKIILCAFVFVFASSSFANNDSVAKSQLQKVMQKLQICEQSQSLSRTQVEAGETKVSVCIYKLKIQLIRQQAFAFVDYVAKMKSSLREDFYQRQLANIEKRFAEADAMQDQLDAMKSHENVGFDKDKVIQFYNEKILEGAKQQGLDIEKDRQDYMRMMHHRSRFADKAEALISYTLILQEGQPSAHNVIGQMTMMRLRAEVIKDLATKLSQ